MADIAELGLYIDSSGVVRATKKLRELHGQTLKNEKSTNKLKRSYNGLGMAVAAVGAVALTRNLLKQINTYQSMSNKLKLVTHGAQNLLDVQGELFKAAQDGRVSLEATTDLYFRFAKSTEKLNISQERLVKITGTVNKAVALSGGEAASSAAALFQMGQGLAAGTLRGQELNSVMEQIPRVAQAIADGMGAPIGQLRKMAEAGELTTEQIINAFENQKATIDREMSGISKTISQAFVQIENVALRTFGTMDASELVSEMDSFKNIISDPEIVDGLQSIAGVFVKITSLAVKAAAGWGMIFKLAKDALTEEANDEIARLETMQSRVTEGSAAWKNLGVQIANAKKEMAETPEIPSGGEASGLGGMISGGGEAKVTEEEMAADLERQLLHDGLVMMQKMTTEEELTRIQAEEEQLRLLGAALASQQMVDIATKEAAARKAIVGGMLSNLAGLMNSGSKKMFKIGKVAAIAQGLLSLRESVTSSYAAGAKVGGPPLGAAYAATAAIAQLANLASIKSTAFGGGGGGGSSGGGGGGLPSGTNITDSFAPDAGVPTAEKAPSVNELRVVIEGDVVGSDAMRKMVDNIADTIEDMGGVGRLVLS